LAEGLRDVHVHWGMHGREARVCLADREAGGGAERCARVVGHAWQREVWLCLVGRETGREAGM